MPLVLILRIALYIQLLLGLGRFVAVRTTLLPDVFSLFLNQRLWETHISLGVLIVLLALVALRPVPNVPNTGLRKTARFFPLVSLATGLPMLFEVVGGLPMVLLHIALGIITIGLVEAAAARQRRALRAAGQAEARRQ